MVENAELLADFFKLFSDPTRVRIIKLLSKGEQDVGSLSSQLEMHQTTISHQLALLKNGKVVRYRKDGKHRYYMLDDEHVESLFKLGEEHLAHD